ncbi:STT3 domain-containing protein [Haladaptatus sp. GCM10025707]|uniref:STT3 domain-containing protein n=1 Tax=unclassified Haladaptatus TaxID=2622732 RepID=UPI0023E88123|nr:MULTISPECIES: STT3 domain-containing protein [unclassified Haladaptatus]
MTDVREATADLLDSRPEVAESLEQLLAIDRQHETWTFADIPLDSGTFGEVVSRNIVEKHDGEYRLADPTAVEAALRGESTPASTTPAISLSLPTVERRAVGMLVGALGFLALVRSLFVTRVFRDGHVVLGANDPYFYRYWVEKLVVDAGGLFDFAALSAMPDTVAMGEPLFVATLWWLSSLFGGMDAVGPVMAWYPVVSAVVTGALVYLLAVELTDDRRVGLASVLLLALIPGHALRTALGFADHHAFDYPWLALTILAVVVLARRGSLADLKSTPKSWAATLALGVALAGQTLAWEAGPLLIVPLGLYVAFRVLSDVRAGQSPLASNLGLVVGLLVGALLAAAGHASFGWHSEQVAFAPALLFVAVLFVLSVAELTFRADLPATALAGLEAVGGVVGVLAFRALLPDYWAKLVSELALFVAPRDIVETESLFSGDSMGFLLLFGFILALALPYVGWAALASYRKHRPEWVAPAVYAGYFFVLAGFQIRFVGEMAAVTAVFAGLGFVHLAERVDLARRPVPFRDSKPSVPESVEIPDSRGVASLVALFLIVASLSLVQVPVKMNQVTADGDLFETAQAIDTYAEEEGMAYPQNFVLSRWGTNRAYNYFVNGESRSYGYAQSTYTPFVRGSNASEWYGKLSNRVGFVVTEDRDYPPGTMQSRLHDHFGSQTEAAPGVAHYQAIFSTESGDTKAFRLVPGATITGGAASDSQVTVTTSVSIPGATFEYERTVETAADGSYRVTVPYAGDYSVNGTTVTVSESAVEQGETVAA